MNFLLFSPSFKSQHWSDLVLDWNKSRIIIFFSLLFKLIAKSYSVNFSSRLKKANGLVAPLISMFNNWISLIWKIEKWDSLKCIPTLSQSQISIEILTWCLKSSTTAKKSMGFFTQELSIKNACIRFGYFLYITDKTRVCTTGVDTFCREEVQHIGLGNFVCWRISIIFADLYVLITKFLNFVTLPEQLTHCGASVTHSNRVIKFLSSETLSSNTSSLQAFDGMITSYVGYHQIPAGHWYLNRKCLTLKIWWLNLTVWHWLIDEHLTKKIIKILVKWHN